jgi:hypothetical protein
MAAMLAADKEWTWGAATEKILSQQDALSTMVTRKPRSSQAYSANAELGEPKPGSCFNCKRAGHFAQDCRSRCVRCPSSATRTKQRNAQSLERRKEAPSRRTARKENSARSSSRSMLEWQPRMKPRGVRTNMFSSRLGKPQSTSWIPAARLTCCRATRNALSRQHVHQSTYQQLGRQSRLLNEAKRRSARWIPREKHEKPC